MAMNEMRSEIQRLVDSKAFIEAGTYLASFKLSEFQSARLSNTILQSSHAEEVKQQARQKAEEMGPASPPAGSVGRGGAGAAG